MSPRKRTNNNQGLPKGLYENKVKGFIYRLPYAAISCGKDKAAAIVKAKEIASKNKSLPEGLFWHCDIGYRFKRVDDSIFDIGNTTKSRAVQLATKYNDTYRLCIDSNGEIPEVDESMLNLKKDKPFSVFLNKLPMIYKEHNSPSDNAYETFQRDCERLNKVIGHLPGKAITLEHVNNFLAIFCSGKSSNVYNRKISFMIKAFDFACDQSVMITNPAKLKKSKPLDDKVRNRLSIDSFKKILDTAKNDPRLQFLYIAMSLSIQTTHAVNEISKIKYRDVKWLEKPERENGIIVYGYLYIHRQKIKKKEASRVRIPVTEKLKNIIDLSRKSNILCPYIVHRRPRNSKLAEGCDHKYQVPKVFISTSFSNLRDKLKLYDHLKRKCEKPTFHEIRALAADQYNNIGYDPQARMAHSDAKSTKVYLEGHVEWVTVPPAELAL